MSRKATILDERLQCPACKADLPASLSCSSCKSNYERVGEVPILVDFARSIVSREAIAQLAPTDRIRSASKIGIWLQTISFGARSELMARFTEAFGDYCEKHADNEFRILVIGGGTEGPGEEAFTANPRWRLFRTDIYMGENVDIVCDGHDLPFRDGSFDAVVCQAVLEHVLDPQRVVDEIHRVLRTDGLVAAGTPFLQGVHMGAYDFTRFTHSGHRWLFRRFEEIASGVRGGPGLSAVWSLNLLARGIGLGSKGAALVTALCAWLNWLDSAAADRWREDGANGVWFVGRQRDGSMSPREMISYYENRKRPAA